MPLEHAPREALALPSISVVIPTYREAANLPTLLRALRELRDARGLELEAIVVDDDSRDGSAEVVEEFRRKGAQAWARVIVRTGVRELSAAVLTGMRAARNDVLVVMDGDLSHPPDAIPRLALALMSGPRFAIGSRYVQGGSTDDDWGFWRLLNSRMATWLARPLTDVKDPMAGFFALRRSDFEQAAALDPVGYKIGLELIVKCHIEHVAEVPIHFRDRRRGQSKLTLRQQLFYLVHLRRLYAHKLGVAIRARWRSTRR